MSTLYNKNLNESSKYISLISDNNILNYIYEDPTIKIKKLKSPEVSNIDNI